MSGICEPVRYHVPNFVTCQIFSGGVRFVNQDHELQIKRHEEADRLLGVAATMVTVLPLRRARSRSPTTLTRKAGEGELDAECGRPQPQSHIERKNHKQNRRET